MTMLKMLKPFSKCSMQEAQIGGSEDVGIVVPFSANMVKGLAVVVGVHSLKDMVK